MVVARDGDVDEATRLLERVRRDVARVKPRTSRLLWQFAEGAPVVGESLRVGARLVDVVDEGAALGRAVLDVAGPAVEEGTFAISVDQGRVDMSVLSRVAQDAGRLDPAILEGAVEALRDTRASQVQPRIAEARSQGIELGERLASSVRTARDLAELLPGLLGEDGPRRYLLAMQNPAEARATGGLIGFFAVLEADRGQLSLTRPEVYGELDGSDLDGRHLVIPDVDYESRYGHANPSGYVANVNLDPHAPTAATLLTDLFAARRGERLDGVVFVDPVALGHILYPIGPVEVPPEARELAPTLPSIVAPSRVAYLLLDEVYDAFEGRQDERKEWLRQFALAAFDQVLDGGWESAPVARRLAEATGTRHLQVVSNDPEEARVLRDLGIDGAMEASTARGDLLALTRNNVAGTKLDVSSRWGLRAHVDMLGAPADAERRASVVVRSVNPRDSAQGPDYVVRSFPISRDGRPSRRSGPAGLNRTWLTVWALDGSRPDLPSLTAEDAMGVDTTFWLRGLVAHDATLEVPAGEEKSFQVAMRRPVELRRVGGDWIYRLHLRTQPSAIPDHVHLTFAWPDDGQWQLRDAEVVTQHASLLPDSDPVELREMDDGVEISGDLDGDLVVELRFVG